MRTFVRSIRTTPSARTLQANLQAHRLQIDQRGVRAALRQRRSSSMRLYCWLEYADLALRLGIVRHNEVRDRSKRFRTRCRELPNTHDQALANHETPLLPARSPESSGRCKPTYSRRSKLPCRWCSVVVVGVECPALPLIAIRALIGGHGTASAALPQAILMSKRADKLLLNSRKIRPENCSWTQVAEP
jgi:hypothetical protein